MRHFNRESQFAALGMLRIGEEEVSLAPPVAVSLLVAVIDEAFALGVTFVVALGLPCGVFH